ncbi:hypothetical protein EMCRGX_G022350 [Ephydatia muelleri]
MQSLVPLFDSPRGLPLPYSRPYPYPPYAGVGYGYPSGSSLQTTVPLIRTMQEHFPSDSRLSARSDRGENESQQEAAATILPPVALRVFRPVDFEKPCGPSKREPYYYEPPTPSEYEGGAGEPMEKPHVTLVDRELWEAFNAAGNEMIVTKPGRRLFPAVCVSVKGLNPRTKYEVSLRVTPADNYRYKYLNSTWIPVGESDILQKEAKHIYIHPNSKELETCTGECWMKKQINFKNVKISHNPASSHGDLLVHTMHKFPETTFIAVTSYQNNGLTQMKIDNNPFAKGFREKEDNGSNSSMYSSPQSSPQGYIPLRMPFCHKPLWITPPGQDKQQSEAELEVAEGAPLLNHFLRYNLSPSNPAAGPGHHITSHRSRRMIQQPP